MNATPENPDETVTAATVPTAPEAGGPGLRVPGALAALGLALVIAGSLLPNLAVRIAGHKPVGDQASLSDMTDHVSFDDFAQYSLGVFALLVLLTIAASHYGRLNTMARLSSLGVLLYAHAGTFKDYGFVVYRVNSLYAIPSAIPAATTTTPTSAKPEVILLPGAYCAIIGLVLLAASVAATGPVLSQFQRLTALRRRHPEGENSQDGDDLLVLLG
jgi:hypothetical protein